MTIPGISLPSGLFGIGEGGHNVWQTVTVASWGDSTESYGYRNVSAFPPAYGSLSPVVSESGHTVLQVSCTELNSFVFGLLGNIASGTLRYQIGSNSILLSSISRQYNGVGNYTTWTLANAPAWMRIV